MSQSKKSPRKRPDPRKRIKPMPPAPAPTIDQVQAENAKLRERNEQLEERNEQLTKKIVKGPADVAQETANASKFAETIGTESREAELERLRANNEMLEDELGLRRNDDHAHQAYSNAFELIKCLASRSKHFESLEVRARPDIVLNRATPFEAVLVVNASGGTLTFRATAADPARALLEALSRFRAEANSLRKIPWAEDLDSLFALIDNQWVRTKSVYVPMSVGKMLGEKDLDKRIYKRA
jgi:cell division septum initiation protein DivIVA